jgi:hypothetical protein
MKAFNPDEDDESEEMESLEGDHLPEMPTQRSNQ